MLNIGLLTVHVLAVIVYLGGGLLFHGPFRRALKLVPPGQASILGTRVGADFTVMSWGSLAVWGISGYWMLFRFGYGDLSAPLTLLVAPGALATSRGVGLLVMIAVWYLLALSFVIITFVLRPRLLTKVPTGADAAVTELATMRVTNAARWIDLLALANLFLAAIGFLSGALLG